MLMTDGSRGDIAALRRALEPMAGCEASWWVAGGWAIDLFLGHVTRPHHDVDLAILRRDQAEVQRHLASWTLRWVEPRSGGRFHPWQPGQLLALPVHEIHGTHDDGSRIELLLNEASGETWHFRRDQRIRRALAMVGLATAEGLPFLAPEVVLLYKAQAFREADEADFAAVRDAMTDEQRVWFTDALRTLYGNHPWLTTLA
jgi:hypothetical protein